MRSWIDHSGGVVWDPSLSLVTQLVEAGQPFWLDIEAPGDEVIDRLATLLGLHLACTRWRSRMQKSLASARS